MGVYVDASVALGMIARRGVGKVRHLDTRMLWIQDSRIRQGILHHKIDGSDNPSDAMTKYVSVAGMVQMMGMTSMGYRDGRAGIAPQRI